MHIQGGTAASTAHITDTLFIDNDAAADGGAVAASDGVVLWLGNVTFSNNTAENGGGVCVTRGCEIGASGVNFFDNTAFFLGGGLACSYDNALNFEGVVARGNFAILGGAFDVRDGNNFHFVDAILTGNFASRGGAVSVENHNTIRLFNITAASNTALDDGGAMQFMYDNVVWINGAVLVANRAIDGSGGALFSGLNTVIWISHLTAGQNRARDYGGSICSWANENISVRFSTFYNDYSFVGGSFSEIQSMECSLDHVRVDSSLSFNGVAGSFQQTDVVARGVTVVNCMSIANALGGTGWLILDSTLDLSDSIFADNVGRLSGAALYYKATSALLTVVKMTNVVFLRNIGAECGAIFIDNTAAELRNVSFFENTALHGNGGAACIGDTGAPASVTFHDAVVENNTAPNGNGGGIHIADGSTLSLIQTEIAHNYAKHGGGIASTGSASLVLREGVSLTWNTADENGGAMFADDGGSSIQAHGGTEISFNRATTGHGGALYLGEDTRMEAYAQCQPITVRSTTSTGDWNAAQPLLSVVIVAVHNDGSVTPECCVDSLGMPTNADKNQILAEGKKRCA